VDYGWENAVKYNQAVCKALILTHARTCTQTFLPCSLVSFLPVHRILSLSLARTAAQTTARKAGLKRQYSTKAGAQKEGKKKS
jgi:hypothetical protein